MTQEERYVLRELFGGALTAELPSRLQDISDFRPVPDNQEVWADGSRDESIVVEIVEHAETSDSEAARFHFNDLCSANEAQGADVKEVRTLSESDLPNLNAAGHGPVHASVALGTMEVVKHRRESGANVVQLLVAVIRLPSQDSDLLVTLNTPLFIHETSSSAEHAGSGHRDGAGALGVLQRVLGTLRVHDWGLFGGG